MSALPAITPQHTVPAGPAHGPDGAIGPAAPAPGPGTRATRPPLRIVTTPTARPARDPLAPTSPAQAWRRRVTALAIAVLTALSVVAIAGAIGDAVSRQAAASVAPASSDGAVADGFVVVEPGDTVWSIAERLAPAGESTASYAGRIVERNGLSGGAVTEWQVLRLP